MTDPTTPDPTLIALAAAVERLLAVVEPAAARLPAAEAADLPRPPDAIDRELARPPRTTATVDLRNDPAIVAFRQAAAADRLSNSVLVNALGVIEQLLPRLLAML
jgi:hypothetical protein